ncbi:MAG: hypothetical protein KAH32_08965 [Chlamydiia bacterium]|nr:hypothetical protein [Chlamydiia bacterium]
MKKLINQLKYSLMKLYFALKEKTYKNKVKYLFKKNHSKELIIIFSAFSGERRGYNYVKTLRNLKIDKLFIQDVWGVKGSYYWFEDGQDEPLKLTESLINMIINRGGYDKIYTAGSSKGGTDAIYFGLQIGAKEIFAGACQYNVGTYLNDKERDNVFRGMMGQAAGEKEEKKLNDVMPQQLKKLAHAESVIYILYSKDEHTYKEHIADLIEDLKKNDIPFTEQVESFTEHGEVGKFFVPFLKNHFGLE